MTMIVVAIDMVVAVVTVVCTSVGIIKASL